MSVWACSSSVMFAMSRSVAGFALFLYVCVVTGQQYPSIRLKGTPTDPSIAIGVISGGKYPAGSFSIGHGEDSYNDEDGGHGANFGENTGNGQSNPNYDSGRQNYPNLGPGQTGGGYVHGQNDIGSYGGPNTQNNGASNGVPIQNPGQKPTNPYDDDYNRPSHHPPVQNSASRPNLFSRIFSMAFSWF